MAKSVLKQSVMFPCYVVYYSVKIPLRIAFKLSVILTCCCCCKEEAVDVFVQNGVVKVGCKKTSKLFYTFS